jgi:hypothetical protein
MTSKSSWGTIAITVGLLAASHAMAASIPAWLDDAISDWNDENKSIQIEFVDIKDSFVWYMIPDTPELGHKEIRSSVYEIIQNNGYLATDQEELVTTGKPPSPTTPYKEKKCWTQSFVLDIEELSNTTVAGGHSGRAGLRQRMLTSSVCEDGPIWFAGFRILQ